MALHDRISGHANRVRVLDRFFTYAKSKPGVWFTRKDEIANWAMKTRDQDSLSRPRSCAENRSLRSVRLTRSSARPLLGQQEAATDPSWPVKSRLSRCRCRCCVAEI